MTHPTALGPLHRCRSMSRSGLPRLIRERGINLIDECTAWRAAQRADREGAV